MKQGGQNKHQRQITSAVEYEWENWSELTESKLRSSTLKEAAKEACVNQDRGRHLSKVPFLNHSSVHMCHLKGSS